jgi:drug/metabolite transporter (DMT)-like permease
VAARIQTIKLKTSPSPLFNVLCFSVFWALQLFITKLGLNTGVLVLPYQMGMMAAALVTSLVLLLPGSGSEFMALWRQRPALFWKLFLANGIQSGLGTSLSIIGIGLTAAINAGFLVKLSTVTTILFARVFLGEELTWRKAGVVVTMLDGAYLLTTRGQTLVPQGGDLLILGACCCWSLGTVLVRKTLRSDPVRADVVTLQKPLASIVVFFSFVGLAVAFPGWFDGLGLALGCCELPTQAWPFAGLSGVGLALTWIFLFRTLKVATASYMTLVSMLTPVLVSALAVLFLGERLVAVQGLGVGMILLSALFIFRSGVAGE